MTLLRYLGAQCSPENADVVLTGVPFDGTASFRPGARFAPQSIRSWSDVLETYSRSFDADLDELDLVDAGDLQFPPNHWSRASEQIHNSVAGIVENGAVPILMGGEHLITLSAVETVQLFYPEIVVLHLDAHLDLREDYEGLNLSHATVMKRVVERVGSAGLIQYGVRSGTREEWELSEKLGTLQTDLGNLHHIVGMRPVYLSIDLDVLDPSVMSETGTPEPGGLSFFELHEAILACRGLKVVAADVVEYCPYPGSGGPSGAVAAKVVRELIFLCAEGKANSSPESRV